MLRSLILVVFVCLLSAGGASGHPRGGTPAAFVTLDGASQVVGVDLATGRVQARIRVPSGPRDITAFGARHLLVVSPRAGTLTLIDSFDARILHIWRGFGRPVAVATNGTYAYVADEARSQLAIVDLGTWKITGRVAVRPAPHDVAAGDVALLTHADSSSNLTVAELSWSRDRVLRFRHFAAGGSAAEIARQPDSALAYVTYSGTGRVGSLDWGVNRTRWQRRVGTEVAAVAVDPYHGRRLWVTDREAGAALALSTEDGRVLRRLRGCPGANGVAVVGSAWVAAACSETGALAVWSQRSSKRRLVQVGRRPYGVAEVVLP